MPPPPGEILLRRSGFLGAAILCLELGSNFTPSPQGILRPAYLGDRQHDPSTESSTTAMTPSTFTSLASAALVVSICNEAFGVDRLVPADYPTIQSAIDACAIGDTVVIAPGVYAESISVSARSITMRPSSVVGSVAISGIGGRVMEIAAIPVPGISIKDIEFRGGHGAPFGGAIHASASVVSIEGCRFFDNSITGGDGSYGGAGLYATGCDVSITGCEFAHCNVSLSTGGYPFGFGGAILLDGCVAAIEGCVFHDNNVSTTVPSASWAEARANGGALAARNSDGVIKYCSFSENSLVSNVSGFGPIASAFGGAVSIGGTPSGRFVISECGFIRNGISTSSSNSFYLGNGGAVGGAICFGIDGNKKSVHTVINCTFENNAASKSPITNGIAIADIATVFDEGAEVTGCTFRWSEATALVETSNQFGATYVGAIRALLSAESMPFTITDSTFCGANCPTVGAEILASRISTYANCCPGDLNSDGTVNGADIYVILGFWGAANSFPVADINGDGVVNGADLATVLSNWGPCPR